jgi:predicted RNA binding protein YcfA (HicA-like mRNA interferase family)
LLLQRLPEAFGFEHVRTKGSHQAYHPPTINQTLIVQPRGKDAKPYQVRQFLVMVEAFDLTLEEFDQTLEE